MPAPPHSRVFFALLRWAALAAVLILMILMLGPFAGAAQAVGTTDPIAHGLAFAVIAAALFLNWRDGSRLQILGVALALGIAVELIQSLTGRDAEVSDFMADLLGALLAALLWPGRRVL